MFKKKKKVDAGMGNYVQARTKKGEVQGVLVSFRGKSMVETPSGMEDIQEITDVTPTQTMGKDTLHFVRAVRRRHGLS